MAALTRNDVNKIIYKFDQVHFPEVVKPASKVEAAREYILINRFEKALEAEFSLEMVDKIVRQRLMSSPSVRALLLYYKGSPALSRFAPMITLNHVCLEGASRELLEKAHKVPAKERQELACFKQLMTLVFEEYFKSLKDNEKDELFTQLQESWKAQSPEQKLSALQRLQIDNFDQANWSFVKLKLQFFSWRIQLIAGRILQNKALLVCLETVIFLSVGYAAIRLYSHRKAFQMSIGSAIEEGIIKVVFGQDVYTRKDLGILDFFKLIGLIGGVLAGGVWISIKVSRFIDSYGDNKPFLLTWSLLPFKFLVNFAQKPFETAFSLPFEVNRFIMNRVHVLSRMMDAVVIEKTKSQFFESRKSFLLDTWHQIILNPPVPVKV